MVRTYQKVPGNRPYQNYRTDNLKYALTDIEKGLSIRVAAQKYNIPKSTLSDHLRMKRKLVASGRISPSAVMPNILVKPGHPCVFSEQEENQLVQNLITVAEWGFPLSTFEARLYAKMYLDKCGRRIEKFQNNLPGKDWALQFLKRHQARLKNQMGSNISTKRSMVSSQEIDSFFNNLQVSLDGVPPSNLLNYDETNLTDDPGKQKVICKRSMKYPERIINSTKTSTSLMFSGTADGHLLPVYVVYKGEHLWNTWIEGGPPDVRYNRSRSGWFDGTCFNNWFSTVVLPWARRLNGRKVVIGDNLSSHFSSEVLAICQENNISFVCLPPNATHILQPLYVAFFAPLKRYWREVLVSWKATQKGRRLSTLPKTEFPSLLSVLLDKIKPCQAENLKSGFRATGIFPIDKVRAKKRIPEIASVSNEDESANATAAMVDILSSMRYPHNSLDGSTTCKRRKKVLVSPGKSISPKDVINTTLKTSCNFDNSSTSQIVINEREHDEASSISNTSDEELEMEVNLGEWVLVEFRGKKAIKFYVGQITDVTNSEVEATFLRRCGPGSSKFYFPGQADISVFSTEQVKLKLKEPQVDRRGDFLFEESFEDYAVF